MLYTKEMNPLATIGLAILLLTFIALKIRKDLPSWLATAKRIVQRTDCDDIKRMAPYPAQPIKGRDRYRVMMDIRKLDVENWLTLDKNYMDEHVVRGELLANEREKVLQCLPESYEACLEALEEVVEFLTQRFANMFDMKKNGEETTVYNKVTGETFVFGGDRSGQMDPLEIAVRLTMEDLSILMKNADGEYYLLVPKILHKNHQANLIYRAASASLFPVGWTVAERIGWTISQLHNPVPLWHQQVSNSVSK
jgi:hypothetical protein